MAVILIQTNLNASQVYCDILDQTIYNYRPSFAADLLVKIGWLRNWELDVRKILIFFEILYSAHV